MNTSARALAVLLFALAGSSLAADPPPTPTSAKGVTVISPEQARSLIGKARFFDMRSAVSFGKGHVKGAVALPYDNKSDNAETFDGSKDRFEASKLPADKNAELVFYSDGPTGWKSYKAAVQAARMGYTNVKWMRDGTAGWVARGLPLE